MLLPPSYVTWQNMQPRRARSASLPVVRLPAMADVADAQADSEPEPDAPLAARRPDDNTYHNRNDSWYKLVQPYEFAHVLPDPGCVHTYSFMLHDPDYEPGGKYYDPDFVYIPEDEDDDDDDDDTDDDDTDDDDTDKNGPYAWNISWDGSFCVGPR